MLITFLKGKKELWKIRQIFKFVCINVHPIFAKMGTNIYKMWLLIWKLFSLCAKRFNRPFKNVSSRFSNIHIIKRNYQIIVAHMDEQPMLFLIVVGRLIGSTTRACFGARLVSISWYACCTHEWKNYVLQLPTRLKGHNTYLGRDT